MHWWLDGIMPFICLISCLCGKCGNARWDNAILLGCTWKFHDLDSDLIHALPVCVGNVVL